MPLICFLLASNYYYEATYHFKLQCHYFLQIRDLHIAEREEDIGYYAGYVGEIDHFSNYFLLLVFLEASINYKLFFFFSFLKALHICLVEL